MCSQGLYRHDIGVTVTVRVLGPPAGSELIVLEAGELVGEVVVEVVPDASSAPLRVEVTSVSGVDDVDGELVEDTGVPEEPDADVRSEELGESAVTVDKKLVVVRVTREEMVSTIKELDIVRVTRVVVVWRESRIHPTWPTCSSTNESGSAVPFEMITWLQVREACPAHCQRT